mgnify:CR=1 FL=1
MNDLELRYLAQDVQRQQRAHADAYQKYARFTEPSFDIANDTTQQPLTKRMMTTLASLWVR